jgi:uncharacterized protein (DUF2062 family)
MARNFGFWGRLKRVIRFRLIMPALRSNHSPEYAARGIMIGVVCGMMPMIGQSWIVLVVWIVARRLGRWGFSPILGMLWTWVSNPLTALPMFYGFYVTGQIMLGRWHDLSGFASFANLWNSSLHDDQGFFEQIQIVGELLVRDWGIAMWTGFLPWSVVAGYLSYALGRKFIIAHRARRQARIAKRQAKHDAGRA